MNQDNRPPAAVRDQQPSANAADDEAAAVETRAMRKKSLAYALRFDDPCKVINWRVAKGLEVLRDQITQKAPERRKDSDGTIGDAAHCRRESDHNPHVRDGDTGVVTAMDITDDRDHACSCEALSEALRISKDTRIKYVIWNHRMFSSYVQHNDAAWAWRSYSGSNPHTKHMHVSVNEDQAHYDDTAQWHI